VGAGAMGSMIGGLLKEADEDVCLYNANSFSSMVQDMFKAKKTEIDFISGAVVREGEKIGVATPANQTMTYLVKALEETQKSGT